MKQFSMWFFIVFLVLGKRWITKNTHSHEELKEELKLKRRKLELEVENLELTNHMLKIDILKREMELGLDRSQFTSSFMLPDE